MKFPAEKMASLHEAPVSVTGHSIIEIKNVSLDCHKEYMYKISLHLLPEDEKK